MSPRDLELALEVAGTLFAVAIVVRRSMTPPITGEWASISWQEAHAAVRMVTRRRAVYAVLCTVSGLALYIASFQVVAIMLGGLAVEALIATTAARWAMRRIEQPQVGLGRRGGWLWVHGTWIPCGESVLEQASKVPKAQSFAK